MLELCGAQRAAGKCLQDRDHPLLGEQLQRVYAKLIWLAHCLPLFAQFDLV
jgi:hypothetical protein